MIEFDVNDSINDILDGEIKNNYKDVVKCFNEGLYNASIVLAYTTMIQDMVKKLYFLNDTYNDGNAKAEIERIKACIVEHKSDWEEELIDHFFEKYNMITFSECQELKAIRDNRHFVAHPLVSIDAFGVIKLKSITKETSLDCIRKVHDYVLVRDASFSNNKIIEQIVIDCNNYLSSIGNANFEKYFTKKYLQYLTNDIKKSLLAALVKFVFKLNDDDCNFNRKNNADLLLLLISNYGDNLDIDLENASKKIDIQKIFMDSNDTDKNICNLQVLYYFMCRYVKIFILMSANNKEYLLNYTNSILYRDIVNTPRYLISEKSRIDDFLYKCQLNFSLYYIVFSFIYGNRGDIELKISEMFTNFHTYCKDNSYCSADNYDVIVYIDQHVINNCLLVLKSYNYDEYNKLLIYYIDAICNLHTFANMDKFFVDKLDSIKSHLDYTLVNYIKDNAKSNTQYSSNFHKDNFDKYLNSL